jgi:hypothetical protein
MSVAWLGTCGRIGPQGADQLTTASTRTISSTMSATRRVSDQPG